MIILFISGSNQLFGLPFPQMSKELSRDSEVASEWSMRILLTHQ